MSERSAVQNPMLKYAQEIGWQYATPTESRCMREGDTGIYYSEVLRSQIQRLNPGIVDDVRASEILRKLNLLHPSLEGNRDVLLWLRGRQSVLFLLFIDDK